MEFDNIILSPFTDGDKAGTDLKYDERFENIENEVNKDNSLYSGSYSDWEKIKNQTSVLLQSETKDYRLLNWYLRSEYKINVSLKELISGVRILGAFFSAFGELAYPLRKRTQIGVVTNYITFIDTEFGKYLEQASKSDLELAIEVFSHTDEMIEILYPNEVPGLLPLIKKAKTALRRIAIDTQKTNTQETKAVTQTINIGSTLGQRQSQDCEISSNEDANKALRQIQEISRKISHFWLTKKIGDSRAYKLNRTLTWLNILQAPKGNVDGATPLKPVPLSKTQHYDNLFNDQKYSELLTELEISLTKAPFWLDGHYLAWQSLEALGNSEGAEVVCREVTAFVQQNPNLTKLTFDDGIPFASVETQDWLSQQATKPGDASKIPAEHHLIAGTEMPWDLALEQAKSSLKKLGISGAVAPLVQGWQQAYSQREQFFWQLSQAQLFMYSRRFDLACSILHSLDTRFTSSHLATWEPVLQERLLALWLSSLQQRPGKEQDPEQIQVISERLCSLNPIRILNI